MAVMQDRGRVWLARAVANAGIYLAWGRGNPAWDEGGIEPEPTNAEALVDEIGRRLLTSYQYVVPDDAGAIVLPDGTRYAQSAQPSKWLHLSWTFDYADAEGETVRELGVFLGGEVLPGLPPGQRYYTAAQVVNRGDLYTMERFEGWKRSGSTINGQAVVLPF